MDREITDRIVDLVRSSLEREFGDNTIETVDVRPDTDRYGDDIIDIKVVLRGDFRELQQRFARTMAAALLTLRPELEKIDEGINPLLSFVAANEYLNRQRRAGPASLSRRRG